METIKDDRNANNPELIWSLGHVHISHTAALYITNRCLCDERKLDY